MRGGVDEFMEALQQGLILDEFMDRSMTWPG